MERGALVQRWGSLNSGEGVVSAAFLVALRRPAGLCVCPLAEVSSGVCLRGGMCISCMEMTRCCIEEFHGSSSPKIASIRECSMARV